MYLCIRLRKYLVYIHTYIYRYIHIFFFTYLFTYLHEKRHIIQTYFVYLSIYLPSYLSIPIPTSFYVYVSISIYINTCSIYIYIYICHIFPKQCLHNGIECGSYVKGKGIGCGPQRRTRRWGGAFVSTLPLWFRANSVAFRRSHCGFAPIPASSGLLWGSLWFRAKSVAFRRSRCGFARIPASSGLWPLLGGGGALRLRAARRSRCGFARIPLRFDAPAVVSREFRPLLASSEKAT